MNEKKNVPRPEGFEQVCVWPGLVVGPDDAENWAEFMRTHWSVRVVYLEEIKTFPDMRNGRPVEGTGGRNDLFFAIHTDDIEGFAAQRLAEGIRWIEDVLAGDSLDFLLYPRRVRGYASWMEADDPEGGDK